MQPNSYANEKNHIPHDPDEKDRELDLTVEKFLPNSNELSTGLVLWVPERKLRNLLSEYRLAAMGPDFSPWIGWAELKSAEVMLAANISLSQVKATLRFEHSAQALPLMIPVNTPWVARA
jgi:hypothetical protein